MVAGLEAVTTGLIKIGDRLVNHIDPADRDIAMVFQNYALYPHMTVRQNMSYGLKNRGLHRAAIESRVAEAATILQLSNYLDRKPRQLSGGQRQRVAMGRAIVREPASFLFDEPLSNLDAKLRVEMRGEIKQIQRRLGTTSIYVTHDQQEAMTLADRLVVLNGGKIEQIGAPLDVYRRPTSTFVAGFIGAPAMNLLDGQLDGGTVRIGSARIPAAALSARQIGHVKIGLRAEDMKPARNGSDGHLLVKISFVEELGAERLVHGHHEGKRLVVSLPADHQLSDDLALAITPEKVHLFDAATGRRLS